MAVQGNLDPACLFGDPATMVEGPRRSSAGPPAGPGHIFNLGHGVLPETPLENLKLLVDTVHGYPA